MFEIAVSSAIITYAIFEVSSKVTKAIDVLIGILRELETVRKEKERIKFREKVLKNRKSYEGNAWGEKILERVLEEIEEDK